jgi:predicted metalloprotease with PDZ domain
MNRNKLIAALAALGLTGWGAAESFAQELPGVQLRPQGVVVTQVFPGGTAARQGIEVGDIIDSVNGRAVRSRTDLQLFLSRSGPVAELGVTDWRTGRLNAVLVYPQFGRIGVDVRPASPVDVRPVPPVYPPWDVPARPVRPVHPISPGATLRQ